MDALAAVELVAAKMQRAARLGNSPSAVETDIPAKPQAVDRVGG
jgi:hypothetical protein